MPSPAAPSLKLSLCPAPAPPLRGAAALGGGVCLVVRLVICRISWDSREGHWNSVLRANGSVVDLIIILDRKKKSA